MSIWKSGYLALSSPKCGISRCEANKGSTPSRSRMIADSPVARSIASAGESMAGAISAISRSPSGLRVTAWCRRSNKGRPMNRSSAWMRLVSAGEESASASAAALTEP